MSKSIENRRRAIVDMVGQFGVVSMKQLREEFPDVSEVTLRKDLKYLDMTQQIIRTHGAAKSVPSVLNYFYRSNVRQAEKKLIAKKASTMIQPGMSIFLAPGTTCAELSRVLPNYDLSICSDGIYTVSCIPYMPKFSVELLGGEVDLNVMRVESPAALNRLDQLHFDLCFMGAYCFHPDLGPAHASAMAAAILEKAACRADKVVLLVDSSKIRPTNAPHRLSIDLIDVIISDDKVPPEVSEHIRSKGIELL